MDWFSYDGVAVKVILSVIVVLIFAGIALDLWLGD